MKILYCASEALPFAMSGGLGDVAGSLPKALCSKENEVAVVLPMYGTIPASLRDDFEFVTDFTVSVGWRSQYCGVFKTLHNGVTYYFIDNEYYFKRDTLYGFYDDGERFAFFSRAIIDMLIHIDFTPDIIHTNDWQTALVSVYLNLYYRHIEKLALIKTVFTIHNIQYQGKYGYEMLTETLSINELNCHVIDLDNCVNFMKGALEEADKITTVSPTYAQEIKDPWFAHGLDGVLRDKEYKTCGILNGIDYDNYNPEIDPILTANYSKKAFKKGKEACKQALCESFNINYESAPIIGIVTRLVGHKGVDLIRHEARRLLSEGFQLVILGNGEAEYEDFFNQLCSEYPGDVGVYIGFKPDLAHIVYAGADIFLMPSKSEPCGLAQMVALRYGAIPVVRETGGLADSITDSGDGTGNGFTFKTYNGDDMFDACLRAKEAYENKTYWNVLVKRALSSDFSWKKSAESYIALYNELYISK